MVSGAALNPDMRAGKVVSFSWAENLGAREGAASVLATLTVPSGVFLLCLSEAVVSRLFLKRPLPVAPTILRPHLLPTPPVKLPKDFG